VSALATWMSTVWLESMYTMWVPAATLAPWVMAALENDSKPTHSIRLVPADFNKLSESEKRHFYECSRCGEMVDKRELDDVLFHEDHVHRPDIQYGGSLKVEE
jgi:hypothetical protein